MIPAAIDLDLLRAYAAVCRQGSLSRAAEVMGRTQPALSMQMRRLEGLLGRALLRRTGRGVVPTPEGEMFLGYAVRILALGDEAAARLSGPATARLGGTVRVAVPEEVASAALPAMLGRFRRTHPSVTLDVLVDDTAAVAPLWRAGKLDVMVGLLSAMPDAAAVVTWSVGLRWTCGLGYEPDGGGDDGPLDLVTFPEPCTWRAKMLDALAASGRAWRVAFTSRSLAAVQAAVENGLGVTLLTPECIRPTTMRSLPETLGLPEPLLVQYGLYARGERDAAADAVVRALLQGVPRD